MQEEAEHAFISTYQKKAKGDRCERFSDFQHWLNPQNQIKCVISLTCQLQFSGSIDSAVKNAHFQSKQKTSSGRTIFLSLRNTLADNHTVQMNILSFKKILCDDLLQLVENKIATMRAGAKEKNMSLYQHVRKEDRGNDEGQIRPWTRTQP